MAIDGPVRPEPIEAGKAADGTGEALHAPAAGFAGGSRALDSLDRLVTSTESFFHPSNSGPWTVAVRHLAPARPAAH
jgi:proteasome activator subunit 4